MHDGMPYGRNQGQGQGHSREVDRQSPTGLIFLIKVGVLCVSELPPPPIMKVTVEITASWDGVFCMCEELYAAWE